MHRQTQGQTGSGTKSAYGATDWQALEVQLNRTRSILQEILVHLQDVLRNLKMARNGGRAHAAAGAEAGRHGGQDGWRRAGSAQRPHVARPQAGASQTTGPGSASTASGASGAGKAYGAGASAAGAGKAHGFGNASSERARSWSRPGHESRAGAGASFRSTPGAEKNAEGARARASAGSGEKARASEGWSFRSGASRPGAGQTFRDRARTEQTFRGASAAGAAGPQRETNQRAATGPSASSRSQSKAAGGAGFCMDEDRQARARAAARRGGMNLKCAYDILCLSYPCSVDEIKVAYRHMARRFHPDLGGDEEAMKDVNVAYELAMRFSAGPRRASAAWAV